MKKIILEVEKLYSIKSSDRIVDLLLERKLKFNKNVDEHILLKYLTDVIGNKNVTVDFWDNDIGFEYNHSVLFFEITPIIKDFLENYDYFLDLYEDYISFNKDDSVGYAKLLGCYLGNKK